jgi:hypothetical protein
MIGKQPEGGAGNSAPSPDDSFRAEIRGKSPEVKTMAKQYKALIDNLVERGVVHAKGKVLMVEVSDDRAKNLINAGYIEEILPEAPKVEKKEMEAPQNKMVEKADAGTKDATGLAASLKNKNKKK